MNYAKTIKYGNNIEIFEYEHRPVPKTKKAEKKSYWTKPTEEEIFTKRADNIIQTKRSFRRLVSANLSNEKPLLITFTYKENMKDIVLGWNDYRKFIQAMRYKYGENFKYIATPEFQERGAVHFHVLFWGLPSEINPTNERNSRTLANIWKKGFIDMKKTDGREELAGYLAKYMAKAFTDTRLKNQKAYVSSKNIKRPEVTLDAIVLHQLIENVDAEAEPVFEKRYDTPWLGSCRYRLFKTKD